MRRAEAEVGTAFPTSALAEVEARLAEIDTTRKVIDGLTLPDHERPGCVQ